MIVRGDRIETVGRASSIPIPNGARIIDLSADTVMPGLIDGHSHPHRPKLLRATSPRDSALTSFCRRLGCSKSPALCKLPAVFAICEWISSLRGNDGLCRR